MIPAFLISEHPVCHSGLLQSLIRDGDSGPVAISPALLQHRPHGFLWMSLSAYLPSETVNYWRAGGELSSSLTLVPSASPFAGCRNVVLGLSVLGASQSPACTVLTSLISFPTLLLARTAHLVCWRVSSRKGPERQSCTLISISSTSVPRLGPGSDLVPSVGSDKRIMSCMSSWEGIRCR